MWKCVKCETNNENTAGACIVCGMSAAESEKIIKAQEEESAAKLLRTMPSAAASSSVHSARDYKPSASAYVPSDRNANTVPVNTYYSSTPIYYSGTSSGKRSSGMRLMEVMLIIIAIILVLVLIGVAIGIFVLF